MNEATAMRTDRLIGAYTSRSWTADGPRSWDAYLAREFGDNPLKLPPAERKIAARAMHESGMPFRAISVALGIGHQTAYRDVHGRVRPDRGQRSVYLIGSPDFRPVKIGKGCAQERLDTLQTASPFLLEILWKTPGGLPLERALHTRFEEFRVRGEWFEFPVGQDPIAAVSEAAEELSTTLAA